MSSLAWCRAPAAIKCCNIGFVGAQKCEGVGGPCRTSMAQGIYGSTQMLHGAARQWGFSLRRVSKASRCCRPGAHDTQVHEDIGGPIGAQMGQGTDPMKMMHGATMHVEFQIAQGDCDNQMLDPGRLCRATVSMSSHTNQVADDSGCLPPADAAMRWLVCRVWHGSRNVARARSCNALRVRWSMPCVVVRDHVPRVCSYNALGGRSWNVLRDSSWKLLPGS